MMKTTKRKKEKPVITVDALVEQGNVALNRLQPELASSFFKRALDIEPENTNLMDAYADVLMQLGEMPQALTLLQKSVLSAPEINPYKWFFYAQLLSGHEALNAYTTGISIVRKDLDVNTDPNKQDEIKKQLAKAYVSIAELYLTDLCFDDGAETGCEKAVAEAFSVIPDLIDAKQTLASIRLSQNRPKEACELISQVFSRIMEIRQAIHARTVVEEITAQIEPEIYKDSPELEFCVSTAKILIECGATDSSMIENAMDLLVSLLEEDDENIELWYITGVASMSLQPPDIDSARYHLDRAKEMMEKLQEHCKEENEEFPFNEQYGILQEHFCILEELEKKREEGIQDLSINNTDNRFDRRKKQNHQNDMVLEEEEEWSTCDEEDES